MGFGQSLLAGGVRAELLAEGSITADGSLQTVLEVTGLGSPTKIFGWIYLTNMDVGDEVVIQTYIQDSNGNWHRHANEIFNDAQQHPAVYLEERAVSHGYKVLLQQTKGTYREYPYEFYKEG